MAAYFCTELTQILTVFNRLSSLIFIIIYIINIYIYIINIYHSTELSSFCRVLRDSTPRYVDPLVGWLVGRSPFRAAVPKDRCPVGHRGEPLIT